jgi:hypothetical protein
MSRSTVQEHLTIQAEPAAVAPSVIPGHRIGRLVGWRQGTGPLVDYPGNPHGPLAARAVVRLSASWAATAVRSKREVLLTFDAEQSDRPVITGVLDAPATLQAIAPPAEASEPASADGSGRLDAEVDGKRVVIEGQDEIVLKCGEASITLRRNGRVVIRGNYVETRSRGVNRIRGGTVEIN